jgi:uncharacterized protein
MNPADDPFLPALGLRSGFLQSMLATKRPAPWLWRRRGLDLRLRSTYHLLDTADEHGRAVTLTGWFTPHPQPRGLVVLIHGWEGCHDSNYLYSMACALHGAGHAVFRLNLRDHGGTHHLNEDLFHSARMQEVLGAFGPIQALAPGLPLAVVGFSLGGNFTLRVGLYGPAAGVRPRLCVAISPVMNPRHTMNAIDAGNAIIHRYFLAKWRQTMDAKVAGWPGRFDFTRQKRLDNFIEITRAFVEDFTEYDTLDDYLARYTLSPAQLLASPTPLAVITAADDSVIPLTDFTGLAARGSVLGFEAPAHGGHCGFIENWRLHSWAERRALAYLGTVLGGG